MAPVEIDSIPRDNVVVETAESTDAKVAHYKVVDKMFGIPVISDTYLEVQKLAHTTGIDVTVNNLVPLVENVALSVKTSVDQNILPHIPADMTETIQKNVITAVDTIDCMACCGIDAITDKLPALKEPVPVLLETTKETVVGSVTQTAEYLASFPLSQVALKVVDLELDTVDRLLKRVTGCDEKNLIIGGIETMKEEVTGVRKAGVKIAGTEKAKKIEEGTLFEAVAELTGIYFLFSFLVSLPSLIIGFLPPVVSGDVRAVDDVVENVEDIKDVATELPSSEDSLKIEADVEDIATDDLKIEDVEETA